MGTGISLGGCINGTLITGSTNSFGEIGHTGVINFAKEMKKDYPVEMVERAVKGMLPKGRLGRQMYKKLFVYEGSEHPHMAQKPKKMEI